MLKKYLPILVTCCWAVSGFTANNVAVIDYQLDDYEEAQVCQQDQDLYEDIFAEPSQTPCEVKCEKPCKPKVCCNPPPPCCWEFNPCNPKGCTDMNCSGVSVSADFLYWSSENHGFGYAYEGKALVPSGQGTPPILNIGKIARIDPKWAPGFRVGLDWNTNHDFWDLFLNYTWYRNHAHDSKTSNVGFLPMAPLDFTGQQYGNVSANSRFMLNMGDIELGRLIYLTRTVAFRPHLGVRGGTLHQKFHSDLNTPLLTATTPFIVEQLFSGKNNYWGVGPRAGLNGEFHFTQGFSVLGKFAGALLYGKSQSETLSVATISTGDTSTIDEKDHFNQLAPNLQMTLGLQWQTCFWCEKMFFRMSASWETNYWWDQFNLPWGVNALPSAFPPVGNKPLTMEGLTINAEWDF